MGKFIGKFILLVIFMIAISVAMVAVIDSGVSQKFKNITLFTYCALCAVGGLWFGVQIARYTNTKEQKG